MFVTSAFRSLTVNTVASHQCHKLDRYFFPNWFKPQHCRDIGSLLVIIQYSQATLAYHVKIIS